MIQIVLNESQTVGIWPKKTEYIFKLCSLCLLKEVWVGSFEDYTHVWTPKVLKFFQNCSTLKGWFKLKSFSFLKFVFYADTLTNKITLITLERTVLILSKYSYLYNLVKNSCFFFFFFSFFHITICIAEKQNIAISVFLISCSPIMEIKPPNCSVSILQKKRGQLCLFIYPFLVS